MKTLDLHLDAKAAERIARFLSEFIFENFDIQEFLERCRFQSRMIAHLLENSDSEIVGVKIGYPTEPQQFYSWLGGVAPSERGKGLASQLMHAQADWCLTNGFHVITTKTMNRWKEMLLLNIRHGFQITGTTTGQDGTLKIMMAKVLKQ